MKHYVKPCIREKNPNYVIFHVGTNELNSELPPERIAKSIIDVAKNTQSDSRIVSISGIVPRNDNFNIKATEVNKELSKMCDKEKLLFLSHSNINPKIHLNKSKLHLNRNGYEKLGKNFVNFIRNNYTWLNETNKKANIDIGVSSTSSTLNEKSEIDNEIADHITDTSLKSLRIRNYVLIGMGMAVVFCCTLETIYHPNFYQWIKTENFVEINLRKEKKWLLSFSTSVFRWFWCGSSRFICWKFCSNYNVTSMINRPTCFKNPEEPSCIDLIFTN